MSKLIRMNEMESKGLSPFITNVFKPDRELPNTRNEWMNHAPGRHFSVLTLNQGR